MDNGYLKKAIEEAIQKESDRLMQRAKFPPRPYFRQQYDSKPAIEDAEYEIVEPMQIKAGETA